MSQIVKSGILACMPQNIKGCTDIPLIDAILIENFILSILFIHIGIGNALVECLLEWVENTKKNCPLERLRPKTQLLFQKFIMIQLMRSNYDGLSMMASR
jgi:hypothetical protein